MGTEQVIRITDRDNVAVAPAEIAAGQTVTFGQGSMTGSMTAAERIPAGHKIALTAIPAGEDVIKYGYPIGHALRSIQPGEHVHTHNLKTNLKDVLTYEYHPQRLARRDAQGSGISFEGYLRADGRAGVRNEVWIIPTVGCVGHTAQILEREAARRFAGRVDGIHAFLHPLGCSQLGEDLETTQKLLAGLVRHPNAGGVLVLSLGCENNHLESFRRVLGETDPNRVRFLVTQDTEDEIEKGLEILDQLTRYAAGFHRTTLSADHLVVGFKCGGSDGLSGITANPLCGRVNDRITDCGGTTILTEVPEMFGAEQILMDRADTEETFRKTVCLINGFKEYFIRHGQEIYENPSPGNKAGGITTLEDKSLGCIQKGGSGIVTDVLDLGEPAAKAGLNLLRGPGNDLVSCTNLTASGAQMILFTTGRGNPFGAPVPTIKVSSNSALAEKKGNWIDFDAGRVLRENGFDAAQDALTAYLLDVASGRVQTNNEINGYREIALFRDGVTL